MAKKKAITLGTAVSKYVAHLEAEGKAAPTVQSYKGDYRLLASSLGEKTTLPKITPARMGKFLKSDPVLKSRKGKRKADASVAKTQRAIRMFFSWCVEEGFIKTSPFPKK